MSLFSFAIIISLGVPLGVHTWLSLPNWGELELLLVVLCVNWLGVEIWEASGFLGGGGVGKGGLDLVVDTEVWNAVVHWPDVLGSWIWVKVLGAALAVADWVAGNIREKLDTGVPHWSQVFWGRGDGILAFWVSGGVAGWN